MKKTAIFILTAFVLLNSCATKYYYGYVGGAKEEEGGKKKNASEKNVSEKNASEKNASEKKQEKVVPLRWTIGYLRDQWGDVTKDKYMMFDMKINALHSNFWDSDVRCYVENFMFSKEKGLYFFCQRMKNGLFNFPCEIAYKAGNGDEAVLKGTAREDGVIVIPYTKRLEEILMIEGGQMILRASNEKLLLNKPPKFAEAFEKMMELK